MLVSARLSAAAEEHHMDRLQGDHGIELERIPPYIIEIELEFLDRVLVAFPVRIIDLRPARDPRFHQMPKMIERDLFFVALGTLDPFCARTDQTHVAAAARPNFPNREISGNSRK